MKMKNVSLVEETVRALKGENEFSGWALCCSSCCRGQGTVLSCSNCGTGEPRSKSGRGDIKAIAVLGPCWVQCGHHGLGCWGAFPVLHTSQLPCGCGNHENSYSCHADDFKNLKRGTIEVDCYTSVQFRSVQFSCSVVSDSFQPRELQHIRPPCPSPTPGVHPNSCSLSQWCHLTISYSVVLFSSCPQSFPASGSFQMSQLSTSGGPSIGVSALASVLPMISFKMDWLDLLAVQGTLKSLLQHHTSKASILWCSAFFTI